MEYIACLWVIGHFWIHIWTIPIVDDLFGLVQVTSVGVIKKNQVLRRFPLNVRAISVKLNKVTEKYS